MSALFGASRVLPTGAAILGLALLAACNAPDPAAEPVVVPSEAMPETAEPAPETVPETIPGAVAEAPIKSAGQAAASAEPAYVGTWGNDLAQCAIEQEYEQPPMIMRADGFDQHEAHCDFDTVTQTGPAEWSVTGQCSVEGDEQPLDYNMAIIDGNLVHWSGDSRKEAWTLVRCPQ